MSTVTDIKKIWQCEYCETVVPAKDKKAHLKRCPEFIKVLVSLKWLTSFEAEIYTRLSYNTLKQRRIDGDIYGTVKGGTLLFDRESIDDYINKDRNDLRIAAGGGHHETF